MCSPSHSHDGHDGHGFGMGWHPFACHSTGEVCPVDAVLPGVSRENAPATWIDGSPARGAAVGERIGRALATVGAWATLKMGGSIGDKMVGLFFGKSEHNMDDSMGTPMTLETSIQDGAPQL